MSPPQVYWLGLVMFLANLGLAVGQHDLRKVPNVDIPNVVSVGYSLSQRGTLTVLSPSALEIISPAPDESPVRTRMLVDNPPPTRWRIWAISKSGIVTTSDWRVIDFTN